MTTTTIQENKNLVRQFISEANDQNYDQVAELFSADYLRHDPDAGVDERGPEPFIGALQRLHEAFPDSEVHIGELIAENDIVAFEGTMTGTHEGSFRGVAPTHKQMEIPGNAMHRISDGKISETWATWNFLAGLQQLDTIDESVE
ncbi:ester cyclase [Haloarcula nitratireducens]|uniref:Ester cyclase n=1 Tax=Haloarcula nitratireducens TaxID=2487749 RepID=A0AAW4PJL2_9EURY|nr:ester cyclase [Halomicroarcula nitratireducens]MBX0297937.1 ester cyclase [Halomicroarcula nitratireducens]